MSGFTIAVLITVAVLCGLGAFAAHRLARRVRRAFAMGRRRLNELRTRFMPPGPGRDAAVLRQRLADEVRSTSEMFAAAPGSRIFQAEPGPLLVDIVTVAGALDEALASIERFPDRTQQRAALTQITPHVTQLIDTCYSARHTMLRTAALDLERKLHTLSASVSHEASSLKTYERAGDELSL